MHAGLLVAAAAPSAVTCISGFLWERLLKPWQLQAPFFSEFAPAPATLLRDVQQGLPSVTTKSSQEVFCPRAKLEVISRLQAQLACCSCLCPRQSLRVCAANIVHERSFTCTCCMPAANAATRMLPC